MSRINILRLSAVFLYLIIIIFSLIKRKRIKHMFVIVLLIFSIITYTYIKLYDKYSLPILNIKGNEIEEIEVFSEYVDKGYIVYHPKDKINVDVKSNVNTKKPGIYDVIYNIKYLDYNIKKIRKVKVVDNISPKIELKGSSTIILEENETYKEEGFIVEDNYDKELINKVKITNNIKNEIGEYKIIYTVSDSSGNTTSVERQVKRIKSTGQVYLTFDDGPSSITSKILDILKEEDIKATFFIVNFNHSYESVIKRIIDEGHTLALHSYTHNYKLIYSSEEAYYEDLNKLSDKVYKLTGIKPSIIRFPGGSSNTISSFNKGIMTNLTKSVIEKGYHYFDWNVDSKDAGGARNEKDVYNNVVNNLSKKKNNVVLMHDLYNNYKTLNALKQIINYGKNEGYEFKNITMDTKMIRHRVNN